jgi:Tfp pilus assembly protein PilV
MRLSSETGQTLIEIAIGMTILSIVLLTATSTAVSASMQGTNSYIDLLGSELTQEGIEQITLYRNYCAAVSYTAPNCTPIESWATTDSTSWLDTTQWGVDTWKLNPGMPTGSGMPTNEDPFTPAKYTRYFQFNNVNTDPVLSTSGITEVEVKVIVQWKDQDGKTQSVNGATVLTNWNGG